MSGTPSRNYRTSETSRAPKREVLPEADSSEGELTIGQMSRLFAVSLRTLRYYEDRGLITPRREGNARFYRLEDRDRLEMILSAKDLGFSLAEMADLIGGEASNETPDREAPPRPRIVTQIGRLERQGAGLDEEKPARRQWWNAGGEGRGSRVGMGPARPAAGR